MIYLVDIPKSEHCDYLKEAIRMFTDESIETVSVDYQMKISEICQILENLKSFVLPTDIVLVPWQVKRNQLANSKFLDLSDKCFVVTAAGNSAEDIEQYTPCCIPSIITVGALNKSGVPAKFSSRSRSREIKWAPGTNVMILGEPRFGTSVASAIYAAFLANAIKEQNLDLVDRELDRLKHDYFRELDS